MSRRCVETRPENPCRAMVGYQAHSSRGVVVTSSSRLLPGDSRQASALSPLPLSTQCKSAEALRFICTAGAIRCDAVVTVTGDPLNRVAAGAGRSAPMARFSAGRWPPSSAGNPVLCLTGVDCRRWDSIRTVQLCLTGAPPCRENRDGLAEIRNNGRDLSDCEIQIKRRIDSAWRLFLQTPSA